MRAEFISHFKARDKRAEERGAFADILEMKLQRVSTLGVVYYVSPGLQRRGVPHAFSTRIGGGSPAPFASFNLGNPGGDVRDDSVRIVGHYRQLEELIGAGGRERCSVHQVHGAAFVHVRTGAKHDNDTKADALFTSDSTRLVSVRVADCCPVLLATADGAVVAAIHAGWRGVVAGVLPATLAALIKESGAAPATICAAIGPCIGREAFEVGTDVLDEFRRVFGTRAPIEVRPNGKGRADIRAGLRLQLLECGVPEEQLDSLELCTVDNPLEFFSHRRDRGLTGRMAALIGPA
jgi:hypothetical protein